MHDRETFPCYNKAHILKLAEILFWHCEKNPPPQHSRHLKEKRDIEGKRKLSKKSMRQKAKHSTEALNVQCVLHNSINIKTETDI